MLKKIYYQFDNFEPEKEDGQARNDKEEMVERVSKRRNFWFGYCGYGLMTLTTKCCCCCKEFLIRRWPYYKRQWFSYQRFKQARAELHREKDIERIIRDLRVTKFLHKTLLKKRQRDIV